MERTVFFREGKNIFRAESYIQNEPEYFRSELKQIADLLSSNGFVDGYRAVKLANGDWSVWLQNLEGELVNYSLFISSFDSTDTQDNDPVVVGKVPSKKRELVIINPAGPKDSVGGFHPGYWSVDSFADFHEPIARDFFLEVVAELMAGVPSENYSILSNGHIAIHIHKPEKAYTIQINCTAMWI
jgi:hypothetical protein